ncbi:hypothetical protein QTP88_007467 [Uroleucon formosanum]
MFLLQESQKSKRDGSCCQYSAHSPATMANILQINLNCCKAAQALMLQMAAERSAHFILVSEPNRQDGPNWYLDDNYKAAIVNVKNTQLDYAGSSEPGFRYISAGGIRYYSCYWSPNSTLADFDDFLLRLERSIRSAQGNILLAGNFNAKHTDWGCPSNDQRGELLSDMVHTTGMATCNRGNSPTFRAKSILDVTFYSPDLVPKMYDWCVLDIESLSDHNYIQFHLTEDPTHTLQDTTRTKLRVDLSKLSAALNTDQLSIVYSNHQSADECAVHLVKKIQEICMTETSAGSRRKSVYWWSPEIANLRKTANYARRVFQRKRKRLGPTAAIEEETAKDAKRHLVKAIKKAKEAAWKSLCDQVENDRWKIVDAMRHMDFPIYLCRMISSYLSNRSASINVNGSRTEFVMTSGVPQGSVLGPTLWNILYDGLLRIRFSASITPIAFADDIALVATAREAYTLENDLTRAAELALTWLEETGLKTALQKTEAMVITKKRLHNELAVNVGGHIVSGRNVLKYLSILIDGKLNFNTHAKSASEKASHAVKNLSRIMPNISAATPSRRRLLANVVHSLLLFGAPIWANRMSSQGKSEVAKVQRKTALRVASAYRTVSLDAALVIADMPPVDLQAEERYEKYAQTQRAAPLSRQGGYRPEVAIEMGPNH